MVIESIRASGWGCLAFLLLAGGFTVFALEAGRHNFATNPYPIEASWFAQRYTSQEWQTAMNQFSSLGGHAILYE